MNQLTNCVVSAQFKKQYKFISELTIGASVWRTNVYSILWLMCWEDSKNNLNPDIKEFILS